MQPTHLLPLPLILRLLVQPNHAAVQTQRPTFVCAGGLFFFFFCCAHLAACGVSEMCPDPLVVNFDTLGCSIKCPPPGMDDPTIQRRWQVRGYIAKLLLKEVDHGSRALLDRVRLRVGCHYHLDCYLRSQASHLRSVLCYRDVHSKLWNLDRQVAPL